MVRGDEESGCVRVVDARFMEVGGTRVGNEELEGGGGTKEREEGVMVDEEWARLLDFGGRDVFPRERISVEGERVRQVRDLLP